MISLKNHPQERVFHNVNLSNLGNVLQRNLRTDRARQCIFRASEDTNLENSPSGCQTWWHLYGFNVCTGMPKKSSGYVTNSIKIEFHSEAVKSEEYLGVKIKF